MDTERPPLDGRRLTDRYVLEEELASGGMGTLWLATDEVLGRSVAIKVLHDHLARDEELLERFRMEAVAAARLSHPAVVRVFDTGTSDGVVFIVMELVEGQTVGDLLAERGSLPAAEAVTIARGVLHALAHAHREGVIHRDVKPGNVLVARGDQVKLADFGIAKAAFAEEDLTTTGNLLGTSRYLSPEQVSGGEVDARSDIYAVGIVLYEMLTGRPPFEAETHIATATMRLTNDPAPPRSLRPGIPRRLEAVVLRALARDPKDRFQTAEEMSDALEHASRGTAIQPAPVAYEEPPPHRSPIRSWVAVPLILLLVAGLIVGGFLLLEGGGQDQEASPGPDVEPPSTLTISDAHSYDPGGDGSEHDENLALAIDGATATSWSTEGYFSEDVGGLKEGVGLVVELEEETEIGEVEIQTELPGWAFSAFAGSDPESFDLSAPIGEAATVEGEGTYQLEPTSTRYLLIWITSLAPAEDDRYRAVVNEISLLPPSG